MKIHYAGGLEIRKNGSFTQWLRGWPCCRAGDFAYKVREQGNYTMDKNEVTCNACLKNMKLAGI